MWSRAFYRGTDQIGWKGRGQVGTGKGVVGGESPLNVLITTGAKLLQGLGKV